MMVIGNYVTGIACYCTIHKLVVIRIGFNHIKPVIWCNIFNKWRIKDCI